MSTERTCPGSGDRGADDKEAWRLGKDGDLGEAGVGALVKEGSWWRTISVSILAWTRAVRAGGGQYCARSNGWGLIGTDGLGVKSESKW